MTANITDVAGKAFDYVIIGGGTTGLTVAARLTEDPNVSVAVLEAGQANLDDPNILISAQFGKTFGDPKYDWCFKTTPQKKANNKSAPWPRGKGLGGSSNNNFLGWIRPPAEDVDAFAKLGNDGWTWKNFFEYAKLTETVHPPSAEHAAVYPHTSVPANRGTSGPVQISIPHHVHTLDLMFQQTCVNKGLKSIKDAYGGDINGAWISSVTMDPKTWTRSYAATAYYEPNKNRANLTVLTEAHVSRILFGGGDRKTGEDEDITATGVEFIHAGTAHVVHAKKEVVLSAGAINSPHILELSGIGRASLLTSLSIPVNIDLPGVGENAQEHDLVRITLELEGTEHETLDLLRDEEFAKKEMISHASGKGLYRTGMTSFAFFPLTTANPSAAPSLIASLVEDLEKRKEGAPPGLKEQWELQMETLRNDGVPELEMIMVPGYQFAPTPPEPGRRYLSMMLVNQHPFSRGHIHAKSSDPFEHPAIEGNTFDVDYDLEAIVQLVKFVRSLQQVEPWKSGIRREFHPGPECETDEQIREFIRSTSATCWHTIGTCSMLPREKQGVVDSKLKVYGTTNLRVADISIAPLHFAAHTQTMAYVIGEKAADFITGKSRV